MSAGPEVTALKEEMIALRAKLSSMTSDHQSEISAVKRQLDVCARVMADAQSQLTTQFHSMLGNVLSELSATACPDRLNHAPE